ncbi:MAG TPA: ELWxxDGT repeat protein, partial [Polyangiaceae bacterium]|nr:ELWxxDGT repeat protein [Polyangiaceae bacterium]
TLRPVGYVCRAFDSGGCDLAQETCSGSTGACPTDTVQAAGTVCRASAGACDMLEVCNGTSNACPANAFLPASTVCRSSAGSCDVAENCPGNSALCPVIDSFVAPGVTCRGASGLCDAVETCSGTSSSCPSDVLAAPASVMVRDVNPGASPSNPQNLTKVGNTLYFSATDTTGTELWKSNGTLAGTVKVKDINAGAGSSNPQHLADVDGTLFFMADNGADGNELWISNGTSGGTVMVKDINNGPSSSNPEAMVVMDGLVYFVASDGATGTELWKSDGTEEGTLQVADVYNGTSSGLTSPSLTVMGNAIYFKGTNAANGSELWKSDGTSAGTVLVKDVNTTGSSSPQNLIKVGSTLFFSANDGTIGEELWKSDGTTAGTVLVKDIHTTAGTGSTPNSFVNANGTLFLVATDASNGAELWKSDGSDAGTVLVKDIHTTANTGSSIQYLMNVGSTLYFSATTVASGAELWKSDGSNAGTILLKDINVGATGSSPRYMTALGSTVLFNAVGDAATGAELWKSDGSTSGTVLVKDLWSGTSSSDPHYLTTLGNAVYFMADDPSASWELWKSGGTASGTVCRAMDPGGCDIAAEACDGINGSCPADTVQPSGTACTPDASGCTVDECNGTSNQCQHTQVGSCGPDTCDNTALQRLNVVAKTSNGGNTADKAIDTSMTSRWESVQGAAADPSWIYVDLGVAKHITQVILRWEGASARNYTLSTAPEGTCAGTGAGCLGTDTPWTTIYTSPSITTGARTDTRDVNGMGRYVRMKGTVRNTAYGYSLYDFQINGDANISCGTCDPPCGPCAICPANSCVPLSAGTVCRAAVPGGCDTQETCDGMAATCPVDSFAPALTACSDDQDSCTEDLCSGTSGACLRTPEAGCSHGLTATYYNNRDFTGNTVVRIDPNINFTWGNGSPDPAIDVDSFSVRWTGQIEAPYDDTYRFNVKSDDGFRLWIDGVLHMDYFTDGVKDVFTGAPLPLDAGVKYDIKMDFYDNGGGASARLLWSAAANAPAYAVVPTGVLY